MMVSGTLELKLQVVVSHLTHIQEQNLGPQQEQYLLLTAEPPLQPL